MTGGVGLASIALAFLVKDIIDLFASAFGMLLVFLPSFVGAFVRKSPAVRECWWSIGIGLLVVVPVSLVRPEEAYLPGLVASLIGYFLAVKTSRPSAAVNSHPQ